MSNLEARLQSILDAYVAKGITGVSAALPDLQGALVG